MGYQTVYDVTDAGSGYRTAAVCVLAAAGVGLVFCLARYLRLPAGPKRANERRDSLAPVVAFLVLAAACTAVAFHPNWLDPDSPAAWYDTADYQTVEGRVDRVDAEPGRTVHFRIHVAGQTLRYDHHRDGSTRLDELRGGSTDDLVRRFEALLRGRMVRVRHHSGQVLQLELKQGG